MRGTDHNHKKGNIFQNTIAHIYYYINIMCLPFHLWYQNSLFCLAILHDMFATGQFCSFPAGLSRRWLDFPLGAGERGWLNINFSKKENISRLENFWMSWKKVYQQEYLFIFASGLWYLATNTSGLGIFSHIFKLKIKGNQFLVSKKKMSHFNQLGF